MSSDLNSIKNAFNNVQPLIWNPETNKEGHVTEKHLSKIDAGIQNLIEVGVLGEEERKELRSIQTDYQKLIHGKAITERDLDPISSRIQKIRNKMLEGKGIAGAGALGNSREWNF